MASCRTCSAPIRWALSKKTGKHIPIDVTPTSKGNLVLEFLNGGDEARPATDQDKKLGRDLYTSHFATCPDAKQWRKES